MSTVEFLQGQLERLFELDGMLALSSELLGVEPAQVGGTSAKGTFARALVHHCASHDGLSTLAEALRVSASDMDEASGVHKALGVDAPLAPGSELKGLRIVELLGESRLSTRYAAETSAPSSERATVHVHVYRKEFTRDRITAWRLLTSARALKGVRDPGLVGIVDAGTLPDGRVFVATEAVQGEPLSARIARQGTLPLRELKPLARTLLRGLATLHERNLLHGYLSAEHVLVVKPQPASGRVQAQGLLAELATARLLESNDEAPGVIRLVGDPSTIAPEVARGGAPTPLSEVYAIGCVLYHALAGVPVYEAETAIDQVLAHLYEEPLAPSERAPHGGITPALDALLLKAISKDPRERFQSVRELAAALDAIEEASGTAELSPEEMFRVTTALHAEPDDPARLSELLALVAPSGAWREAVEALIEVAELAESPDTKKRLTLRAARILADELSDAEGAEVQLRHVLALDPSDAEARDAIAELHRARGDHEQLVGLLLDRIEGETSPDARATLLREVAGLYEHELGQPDNAIVAYTQVLSERPDDERAKHAIERLASEPSQLEEVVTALADSIAESADPSEHALPLSVIVADWYANRLQRPDAALPYLSAALGIDPKHEPALEAMSDIYRKAEVWGELMPLLLARAEATDSPSKRRDFKAEAAAVAHEQLGDDELAKRLFAEVLDEDPMHPLAVTALEEIYADSGELEKLVDLLEQKAKELRGSARATALCELAELFEDAPARARRAIEHYESALAADDKHTAAYRGLERIYAARGDHEALLDVLERQRPLAVTPQQKAALLERLGSAYEQHLGDLPRAVECFEQVLALAPSHDGAYVALERLYRAQHRFEELAKIYDRHAKGVEDRTRKVELLMETARVLMADLGSPERAGFVCERVLAVLPDHPEALALTARIRALAGDTVAALDALELLADTEQDAHKKADLWVRAGQLVEEGNDVDGAVERYKLALDAFAAHAPAFDALTRVYERRGDARGEADLLLRQVELASADDERADKLVALGKVRLDKLKDRRLAADAYQRALELDPSSHAALLGLGQLALAEQRYEDAAKLLEPLLEHTTELPAETARRLLVGAGDAFRHLGRLDQAERAYLSARALSPDDPTLNERLADVAIGTERYEDACTLVAAALDKGGSALAASDRCALLMKLGRARRALGEHVRAAAAFAAASELAPAALEPLEALAAVQEQQGQHEALVRTLGRMLQRSEGEARFELLVRTGDLHAQLKQSEPAARSYLAALELHADDRNLLSKLMAVYSEDKDWTRLVEVLVRLANVVHEPQVCAKYLATAARIVASELGDLERASEYYETAIGFDPALEVGFRGLVDCLGKAGQWDRVASAYKTQIEQRRSSLSDAEVAALWDTLGSVYLERLHRLEPAVEAYEAASALDPDSKSRLEQLVELYGRQPSRFAERAIAAHEQLLSQNAYRAESYRSLRKLYTQLSRPDEAWVVCQALRSLSFAEPEEEAFFKRHRVHAAATARECISDELWRDHILLSEQDDALTHILALIQPAAVQALAQSDDALGIARERALDCEHDTAVIAQMLHYASGVILVPLPPVFQRPRDPGGVSFLCTDPPAIALGQGALAEAPDQALAFIAGRQLSYFRPGHYMRQLVPTGGGLRSWMVAAMRLANPRFPVPEVMREQVEKNHGALVRSLAGQQQQALTSRVEKLLREQPELDMKRWALAVDLAADRVGFILANSLDAAVAVVRASPEESSYASERDRLKALYQYAVSPQYLALRHAIGVTIG